jgi:hypothetical protein
MYITLISPSFHRLPVHLNVGDLFSFGGTTPIKGALSSAGLAICRAHRASLANIQALVDHSCPEIALPDSLWKSQDRGAAFPRGSHSPTSVIQMHGTQTFIAVRTAAGDWGTLLLSCWSYIEFYRPERRLRRSHITYKPVTDSRLICYHEDRSALVAWEQKVAHIALVGSSGLVLTRGNVRVRWSRGDLSPATESLTSQGTHSMSPRMPGNS